MRFCYIAHSERACCLSACYRNADVAFLVDSSSNIREDHFKQIKTDFIKRVIDNINVAEDQTNIAFITYADQARLHFNLDRYHARLHLKQAVDNITYAPTGASNLADALRLARQEVFVPGRGDRSDLPNIIIVVTNRGSSNATATSEQARLARLAGLTIMPMVVKGWLSMSELYDVTSEPVENNLLIVESFNNLTTLANSLKTTVCQGGEFD